VDLNLFVKSRLLDLKEEINLLIKERKLIHNNPSPNFNLLTLYQTKLEFLNKEKQAFELIYEYLLEKRM